MKDTFNDEIKRTKDISLLYVNIPFCKSLCHFCYFCKRYGPDLLAIDELRTKYVNSVLRELAFKSAFFNENHTVNLKAINFGGGTPSILAIEELEMILSSIVNLFDQKLKDIIDISIEVTPDSLSLDKIKQLKRIGFNRISIGAQTFNQNLLSQLNRKHSTKTFFRAYGLIRSEGFKNVNVDLLYGLPGQSFEDLKKDLDAVVNIDPEHISPSPLVPINRKFAKIESTYKKIDWIKYVHEFLEEKGYINYFQKYFSKIGKESVSELIYFNDVPYIGVGAGATSWIGLNPTNIRSYIQNPFSLNPFTKNTKFNPLRAIFKFLLFPNGININEFNEKYNCDVERIFENPETQIDFYDNFEEQTKKEADLLKTRQIKYADILRTFVKQNIILKENNVIKIRPEKRFSEETLGLYISSI